MNTVSILVALGVLVRGCNVDIPFKELFSGAHELNCAVKSDGSGDCWFKNCEVTEKSEAECCDADGFGNNTVGCKYSCTSSYNYRARNEEEPSRNVNVDIKVNTKTTGCDHYKVTDTKDPLNPKVFLIKYCASGESCNTSSTQAEVIDTHIFRWDCQACKVNEAGQDIYELAPVLHDDCCDKCESTIKDFSLNQKKNANFLICGGCDSLEESALDNLNDYLKADKDEVDTTKYEVMDGYRFEGSLAATFYSPDSDIQEDKIQNIQCVGAMNSVQTQMDIKQFDCSLCQGDQKDTCCGSCSAANANESDKSLYDCKGCTGEDALTQHIVDVILSRSCFELREDVSDCEKEPEWTASVSAASSESKNTAAALWLRLPIMVLFVFLL